MSPGTVPPMFGSVRFASLSAIAGTALGIALTPFMAAVWAYNPPFTTPWATMTWVERTFGPTLEAWGALSFGRSELGPYEIYGKGFFLVYVAMVPIVRLVHERYRSRGGDSRWELWIWRVMWASLIIAAIGDFTSYWGVSLPGAIGDVPWSVGFMVEMLAALVLLLSATLYGLVSLRLRVVPLWASVLLIAVIPLAILTLSNVVEYIPNGFVLPLSITWAAVGVWMLVQTREVVATA